MSLRKRSWTDTAAFVLWRRTLHISHSQNGIHLGRYFTGQALEGARQGARVGCQCRWSTAAPFLILTSALDVEYALPVGDRRSTFFALQILANRGVPTHSAVCKWLTSEQGRAGTTLGRLEPGPGQLQDPWQCWWAGPLSAWLSFRLIRWNKEPMDSLLSLCFSVPWGILRRLFLPQIGARRRGYHFQRKYPSDLPPTCNLFEASLSGPFSGFPAVLRKEVCSVLPTGCRLRGDISHCATPGVLRNVAC